MHGKKGVRRGTKKKLYTTGLWGFDEGLVLLGSFLELARRTETYSEIGRRLIARLDTKL